MNVPPVICWSYAAEALTFPSWHTLGGVRYSHTTELGEGVSVLLLFFSLPVESCDVTLPFPNGTLSTTANSQSTDQQKDGKYGSTTE